MKFLKRAGIVLVCMGVLFAVYYGAYRIYLYKYGNEDKEKFAKQLSQKSVEANSVEENKITHQTKLVIEHYNRNESNVIEENTAMPVEYIGMSREELADYLEEYSQSPNLSDAESGFEKYQITSFSPSQVVLRKIYSPSRNSCKFYLTEENGCVTVYYIDHKTIYEYTNIIVETLPQDIQDQIKHGLYISDEDALYDFLETYTS
ncbi:MAG: hypothetical protein HFI75_14135 [Lachnospiraceae bacterium]|nr:hypothetical protein [Lachnospiraceae bacterium]